MLVSLDEAWYGLCDECRAGFGFEQGERCGICGKPLISETGLCLDCREQEERPAYDRLISVYPYMGKYHKLLSGFKFGKSLAVGRFLAEKVWEAIPLLHLENEAEPMALVPVPPRPGKIKAQGWDQIEWLARTLAQGRALEHGTDKLPVSRCLKRLKSETQKQLDRKSRLLNLKGRIIVNRNVPKTAVLVDDVFTTGATMDACAAALKAAGAGKVYGICLFYS
jgi:ComF family protein